jgi:hypothetical protein
MQHFKILERAWEKTWQYRALWIFGLLVALTAGGGGGGSGRGGSWSGAGGSFGDGFEGAPRLEMLEPLWEVLASLLIILVILFALLGLVFGILAAIARYVGQSALMQLVDREEADGIKPTLRDGFRFGWSSATLRLFLVNLVVRVPLAIFGIVLILLSGTPLLLWLTKDTGAGIVGTVLAVGLFILALLFLSFIGVVVGFFQPFYRRRSVLAGRDAFTAVAEGVSLTFQRLGDVLLMWIIMVVVNILGGLALTIGMLLLALVALLIGGLPALLLGWLFSGLFNTSLGYILGAIGILPWLFGLVILPSLLLEGLFAVFKSTVWTLTYRNLLAMNATDSEKIQEA